MLVSCDRIGLCTDSGSSNARSMDMCQRLISRSLLAVKSTISFVGTLGADGRLRGSMARNCTAFVWPFSLCRTLPVLRFQRMIVESAEPERSTGTFERVVVRRHLMKSV